MQQQTFCGCRVKKCTHTHTYKGKFVEGNKIFNRKFILRLSIAVTAVRFNGFSVGKDLHKIAENIQRGKQKRQGQGVNVNVSVCECDYSLE